MVAIHTVDLLVTLMTNPHYLVWQSEHALAFQVKRILGEILVDTCRLLIFSCYCLV